MRVTPEDGLVAKCWDLSDAFKQVSLCDDAFDRDSYLAVCDPNSNLDLIFKQSVLPFGSIASQLQYGKSEQLCSGSCGRHISTTSCALQGKANPDTLISVWMRYSRCWAGGYPSTSSQPLIQCVRCWGYRLTL